MEFIYLILSIFLMFVFILGSVFVLFYMLSNSINSVFHKINFLVYDTGKWKKKVYRSDGEIIINNSLLSILLGKINIIGMGLNTYEAITINSKKYYKAISHSNIILPFIQ